MKESPKKITKKVAFVFKAKEPSKAATTDPTETTITVVTNTWINLDSK